MDLARPRLLNPRGEGLPQPLEADDHVRDHLGRIVRAHADRADPGQELLIAFHVGDQIEHRSEEHTSELQSLMRISYAVFCLKKKNQKSILLITNLTPIQSVKRTTINMIYLDQVRQY